MWNHSTQPLARPAASPVLRSSRGVSTRILFRAAAKGARHVDLHRVEKPPLGTGFQQLPPITAVLRSLGESRNAATRTGGFETRVIDSMPALLQDSYRLRYQVYCVERGFLSAAAYPQAVETDEFDPCSVHIGATDRHGTLAGTARLILPSQDRLPTLDYCAFPATGGGPLWGPRARWVEASRLSVSRCYGAAVRATDGTAQPGRGDDRGDVFLAILKALYQASRRLDATHWLVSIERSLQRLLARAGFPFRQLGPGFDYLGAVAAYSMDLREFEAVIASGRYPDLADFVVGFEPRYRPAVLDNGARAGAVAGSPLIQLSLAG